MGPSQNISNCIKKRFCLLKEEDFISELQSDKRTDSKKGQVGQPMALDFSLSRRKNIDYSEDDLDNDSQETLPHVNCEVVIESDDDDDSKETPRDRSLSRRNNSDYSEDDFDDDSQEVFPYIKCEVIMEQEDSDSEEMPLDFLCMRSRVGADSEYEEPESQHVLTHSGRRPHGCEECGKRFTEKYNLITHSLIHSGLRPHKCDECGKCFIQKGDLTKHSLTHYEPDLFPCG
uniref:C2H2-type domain-containing protein n=1 Tax=Timema genevievae TaxID=629358 RepID=A0A7R9K7T9_TIMGE|nr:unnamed protein product [Timema genevievae]